MKKRIILKLILLACVVLSLCAFDEDCGTPVQKNKTALDEQTHIESNQARLNAKQPSPNIDWSLERDNLIKRFKLQNDRSISFYMYVFIEGVAQPIGYYQVNKVSSVNSQLTATQQLVTSWQSVGGMSGHSVDGVIESPAEDGSYGTNGDAVFGFTPEDVYTEHNMHYLVSSIPLTFEKPVVLLGIVNSGAAQVALDKAKLAMNK